MGGTKSLGSLLVGPVCTRAGISLLWAGAKAATSGAGSSLLGVVCAVLWQAAGLMCAHWRVRLPLGLALFPCWVRHARGSEASPSSLMRSGLPRVWLHGCGALDAGSGARAHRLLALVPAHCWVGLAPVLSDWTIAFALVCGIGSWTL